MKFGLIARAGISQSLFASMCGVSRATVNSWVRGRAVPHSLHVGRVDGVLTSVENALGSGGLPLNMGLRAKGRTRAIIAAVELAA
jgi:transcriptional regulator with XRE-family HTH domain